MTMSTAFVPLFFLYTIVLQQDFVSATIEKHMDISKVEPADSPSPFTAPSDVELDRFLQFLTSLLRDDEWDDFDDPLFYVEGFPQVEDSFQMPMKRSRYYRRYPWKRQNGKNYDPDGYICNPTKEDLFQLLVALHEAKEGKFDRTVNFCNRRRPARAIFTNIRFLGRRRK